MSSHTLEYERPAMIRGPHSIATYCIGFGTERCVLPRVWANFPRSASVWSQFAAFCIDIAPNLLRCASILGPFATFFLNLNRFATFRIDLGSICSVLPRFGAKLLRPASAWGPNCCALPRFRGQIRSVLPRFGAKLPVLH